MVKFRSLKKQPKNIKNFISKPVLIARPNHSQISC